MKIAIITFNIKRLASENSASRYSRNRAQLASALWRLAAAKHGGWRRRRKHHVALQW
jgi:CO/xanthine dehydrogenase FAD-binding subunit